MKSLEWTIERLLLVPPEELGKGIDDLCNQIFQSPLEEEAREEAYKLFELLKSLENYEQVRISPTDWAWPIFKPFMQPGENLDAKSLGASINKQIESFVGHESDQFITNIRHIGILSIAKYFFYIFLQVNWTGPKLSNPKKPTKSMAFKINDNISADGSNDILFELLGDSNRELVYEQSKMIKAFASDLNIDGEVIYEMTRGIGYLWACLSLLQIIIYNNNLLQGEYRLKTLFIWYSRVIFIWQRIIRKAYENTSPTLFDISIQMHMETLKKLELLPSSFSFKKKSISTLEPELFSPQISKKVNNEIIDSLKPLLKDSTNEYYDSMPQFEQIGPYEKSSLLLEFAIRLSFYGYTDSFNTISDLACEAVGFRFELSGAYGIRRKYQTEDFAQLVVKTFSESTPLDNKEDFVQIEKSNGGQNNEKHKYWSLSDVNPETDILENPLILEKQEDGGEITSSLSAFEQCLLLARCSYLQSSTPASADMAFEELAAIVQRCLVLPRSASTFDPYNPSSKPYLSSHWLVFSSGLWFRCKAENHRLKTVERASLQLQSLVDQYYDEEPSGSHRLNYIHILDYPNQWEAKRELGIRMLSIGSFISAYNMFKDMMMWEEAVNCLVAANRKAEAKLLVEERLAIQPSPPLWCVKGQLDDDHKCYIKAWELSKNRYAGAQRLLGSYYFRQQNFKAAIEAFDLALEINPLNPSSWFTLGCSLMRLELWQKALLAFSKVVSLEPEQGEAWANMAGIHIQKQKLKEAVHCIEQALRYNREDWRIWDTYLKVNVQLRDIPKVIEAMNKMILDFKMKQRVPTWCFEFLYQQATSEKMEGFKENFDKVLNFFEFVNNEIPNSPQISFLYASTLKIDGQYRKSFNIIISHLRQVQARLFSPNSHNLEDEKIELEKSLHQILSLIPDLGNIGNNDTKTTSNELKLMLKAIENRMKKFPDTYHESSVNLIHKILIDVGP